MIPAPPSREGKIGFHHLDAWTAFRTTYYYHIHTKISPVRVIFSGIFFR